MKKGERPIRILFLEDLPADCEIARHEIEKANIDFNYRLVEREDEFRKELKDFNPDIIVSDYSMPLFDGMAALEITKSIAPFTPFVMLTGSMNEETAVACMKAGANDYVIKEQIKRLPFSIIEVIEKSRVRKEKEIIEKQLQESEKHFRTLADSGQALIWTTGVDKKCNYINQPWLNFTGRKPEQELGDGWTEVIHPDDRDQFIERYSKAFDRRENFSIEYRRLHHARGEYRWMQDDGTPRYNSDGEFIGYIGHCFDITERKHTEEKLEYERHLSKNLMDNIPDNIYYKDIKCRFIRINMAQAKRFGLKDPELAIGKTDFDFFGKEHAKKAFLDEQNIIKTGESVIAVEEKETWPDGSITWVSTTKVPFRDNKGKIIGTFGISRDITRRKIEENVQHMLYEIANASVSSTTFEDLLFFVREKLSHVFDTKGFLVALYNPETGMLNKVLYDKSIDNDTGRKADKSLAGYVIKTGRNLLLCKSDIPVFAARNKIKFTGPPAACWLGIPIMVDRKAIGIMVLQNFNDEGAYNQETARLMGMIAHELAIVIQRANMIRDLIAAKEKAEESDRLKSAFLANVSHEIRTPMNGILGFLDLLREPELNDERKNKYIDVVNKSARRLLNTINDIIETSKLDTGQKEVKLEGVDIPSLLQSHYDFFNPLATEKGLSLKIAERVENDKALVLSDINILDSIFNNLINNAIKFTNIGSIEIGNYIKDDSMVFYVRDTGIGIPSDKHDVIFERFVQADLNMTREHEGSGLGLTITKACVEALGGQIWVQSEVNKGSTFSFSIPLKYSGKKSKTKETVPPRLCKLKGDLKVLVAEDDETSYLYFETILENEGLTLLHTVNGKDTVAALHENPDISLVFMDIKMPGMDGLEATRQIRQFNKTIPIIAQTAYAMAGDRNKAMEAGCNDYLSKPVNHDELIRIIDKYTRQK